jgi:hypothetical protein
MYNLLYSNHFERRFDVFRTNLPVCMPLEILSQYGNGQIDPSAGGCTYYTVNAYACGDGICVGVSTISVYTVIIRAHHHTV